MARVATHGFEGGHTLMFPTAPSLPVSGSGAITGLFGLHGNFGFDLSAVLPIPALSEFYAGMNIRSDFYSSVAGLFSWRKSGTTLGGVRMTATSQLSIWVSTTKVLTGSKILTANQAHNVQIHGLIADGAGGSLQVRVDGVLDIDYSSQDTKPGADADINEWAFGPSGTATGAGTVSIDDFVLNDTTGGTNNSWPGIRYIYSGAPTGDSATNNAWSRSTGSDGWSLVDERPHNTSDYVYSGTNGQQQGFTHAATGAPAASNVKSVIFEYLAWKISDGQIKVGCRSDTTESLSAAQNLGISPSMLQAYFETDPDTAAAWILADAEAAESLVESVI